MDRITGGFRCPPHSTEQCSVPGAASYNPIGREAGELTVQLNIMEVWI